MVYITHVRFGGGGSAAEDIVMFRWRVSMGDSNVTDMIEWIDSGGIAKVQHGDDEHRLMVVREDGKPPYLQTVAGGQLTNQLALLPRF